MDIKKNSHNFVLKKVCLSGSMYYGRNCYTLLTLFQYSKTCVKGHSKNRQNKGLNNQW